VIKTIYKDYPLKLLKITNANRYELFINLKNICAEHSIHFSRCFVDDRKKKVVAAKVHFARFMKINYPDIQDSDISDFLNCDRTTILYYWYHCGIDKPLPKLVPKNRNQYSTIDGFKRIKTA